MLNGEADTIIIIDRDVMLTNRAKIDRVYLSVDNCQEGAFLIKNVGAAV